jgi:hypothetical protein
MRVTSKTKGFFSGEDISSQAGAKNAYGGLEIRWNNDQPIAAIRPFTTSVTIVAVSFLGKDF